MAAAKDSLVPGDDGWISDESTFYGDDGDGSNSSRWEDLATGAAAETRASIFSRIAARLPAALAAHNLQNLPSVEAPSGSKLQLYWPLEGQPTARQSNETPAEFVARLPPSRSNVPSHGDWLWVHNPRAPPLDPQLDLEGFEQAGTTLLNEHLAKHGTSLATDKGKQAMAQRDELARSLRDVAVEFHCLAGKWMLFPRNDSELDRIWRKVVEAVADNQLGPRAKIATASASDAGSERLICLYTKDFTDLADVRRVLNALVKLKLVDSQQGASGVWYKSDAYTHLGIQGQNPYGLRNSLYGSRDMLGLTTSFNRRR